jgi:iron complex outermembrane recepter protein
MCRGYALLLAILLTQLAASNNQGIEDFASGSLRGNSVATNDSLLRVIAHPDTQTYRLPFEMIITAPRVRIPWKNCAGSITIIGPEALKSMPRGVAVDEALASVPGVKVDNQANGERVHISIRGQGILTETGIRSIKVLQDDIPMNDPSGFVSDLFDVNLDDLERIEVLKGPATSLYGGGAAGGIMNFVTRAYGNSPLSGEFSFVAGSNRLWKAYGQLGGKGKDLGWRVSVSRTRGAGYRVHTHFWQDAIHAKTIYTPNMNIQITPILTFSRTYHENPEGLSLTQYMSDPTLPNDDAVPYNEHMETERTTIGAKGTLLFHDDDEIRFNGYVKRSTHTDANNHVFDHQAVTRPGMSLQYTHTSGSPDSHLRNKASLGMDLQWQTNDEHLNPNEHSTESSLVLAHQEIRQRGVGFFLLEDLSAGEQWNVMGSLRFDRIHNELTDFLKTDSSDNSGNADFSNLTARIGATFSLNDELSFYGAWGQGFIPPSTNELSTNPNGYGGFNTDLMAATSSSFEVGARGTVARGCDCDVTYFFLTTTNDFDRYRMPNRGHGEEGTFYRNVGATQRHGLEVFVQYQPAPIFNLQLAYTYSHFKYYIHSPIPILMDDPTVHKYINDGSWLPNSPQHQLSILGRLVIVPGISLSLTVQTMSKWYIDGANLESEAAKGFTLLGGMIAYRWDLGGTSGVLSIQTRNLGNVRYIAFTEPDPGGNSYQPGPGREFFVKLSVFPKN